MGVEQPPQQVHRPVLGRSGLRAEEAGQVAHGEGERHRFAAGAPPCADSVRGSPAGGVQRQEALAHAAEPVQHVHPRSAGPGHRRDQLFQLGIAPAQPGPVRQPLERRPERGHRRIGAARRPFGAGGSLELPAQVVDAGYRLLPAPPFDRVVHPAGVEDVEDPAAFGHPRQVRAAEIAAHRPRAQARLLGQGPHRQARSSAHFGERARQVRRSVDPPGIGPRRRAAARVARTVSHAGNPLWVCATRTRPGRTRRLPLPRPLGSYGSRTLCSVRCVRARA